MRPLSCGSFENIIDEDEFIVLYDLDKLNVLPYNDYVRFYPEEMDAIKANK